MSQPVNKPNNVFPIDLFADLELSCETATIDIKADGDSIIIRLSSPKDAFKLLTLLEGGRNFAENMRTVDRALAQADVTLFWHNRHFAILGSKAKPYLLKTIVGLQKVIKLITFSAIRRRRSH